MFLAALVFTAAFAWQASNALELATPQSISGTYAHETASFGPPALSYSVSGVLVLADPENACNPLRWTNASAPSPFAGALVLAMRGNCSFAAKVLNIQVSSQVAFLNFPRASAVLGNPIFTPSSRNRAGQHTQHALNSTLHPHRVILFAHHAFISVTDRRCRRGHCW
jgi:hypothetical protein